MAHARQRLTRKLLVLLVVPIVAGLMGLGVASAALRHRELLAETDRELVDHAASLRATLPPLAGKLERARLVAAAAALARQPRVHGVALYDAAGVALAHSPDLVGHAARLDAMARAALGARRAAQGVLRLGGSDVLVRVEPLDGGGAVLVSHDLAPVAAMIRAGTVRIAVAGVVLAAVMTAVALWLARALGRGIGDLVHGASRVAAGDLAVRLREDGALETGRAARSFNAMAEALAQARASLERADADRRELERRLQHSQGLAIAGEVAASLAHEIGSPLSVILGTARVAADDPATPEGPRAAFATIATQCERITRIVHRLLAVARPAREARTAVDVGEVAREVVAFLEPDCRRRGVAARLEVEDALPRIDAVRDHVLQVMMNLCVNALQAQPGGGQLAVAVARAPRDGASSSGAVALEVRDAGPGIAPENRARIFEPFFSTRHERGGTGLGLAVVSRLVREAGGAITVGDAPEGGAKFRVEWPLDA